MLGILYQSGFIQFHDSKEITTQKEVAKSLPEKKPVMESQLQTSSQSVTPTAPAVNPVPTANSKLASQDWGTILSAHSKTNIRQERSITSKITGTLKPGQTIKADFLTDDWYAIFPLKETERNEAKAMGYVYAPRFSSSSSKMLYTLQIKAVRDISEAQGLIETLKKQGMNAGSGSINIPGKGTWYRIYIGNFTSKEEAIKFMNETNMKDRYPGSMVKQIEQVTSR